MDFLKDINLSSFLPHDIRGKYTYNSNNGSFESMPVEARLARRTPQQ